MQQVLQSDGAPQASDTAARPAAAREAAAEQMQSPVISSGHDVDAGEQMIQHMLSEGVSLVDPQTSVRMLQQLPNEVVSL